MSTSVADKSEGAAGWLAAALVFMPFLQALPVDFDRSGTLILLAPALWAGRRHLSLASISVVSCSLLTKVLIVASIVAVGLAVALADQPAAATVTAASWILLVAAGVIAGQSIRHDPRAGRQILGGLALGATAGTLAVWSLWLLTGRGTMPLYAHHRHLGLHTLAAAIATTSLIFSAAPTWSRRCLWWSVGIVVWGGLLWSGGRTPLLAVALALALWFVLRPQDRSRLALTAGVQLIAGLALSAAFWTPRAELGWWHALNRTSAAVSAGSTRELTSARSEFWRETVERALAAPWLGHGPDSYRFLMPKLDGQQPHNIVLQLWLDLGFLGALPLLTFLAVIFVRGWCAVRVENSWYVPWPALLTASLIAGLLDGVFYHLIGFLPAMLAIGATLKLPLQPAKPWTFFFPFATASVALAIGILSVHSWIFYALALGDPPHPTSFVARSVRAFPSSTFGLWRWLDDWQTKYPDAVFETLKWAQAHSASAPTFHIYAARVLIAQGNRRAAQAELIAARDKAHSTVRPAINGMLDALDAAPP